MDVLPDIELSPIGQREDANAFTLALAGIIDIPEFRTLIFRIPALVGGTKRKDALLGAGLFLIAACAAECDIEAVLRERLLQSLRLPKVGMQAAVIEGVDAPSHGVRILMHDELHAAARRDIVAHFVHGAKLPARIHVQEWKGWNARIECLAGQMQHDGAVLACRTEHYRFFTLRNDFTHDVNAFGFEPLQMSQGDDVILRRLLVHSAQTYAAACAPVKPRPNMA